MQLIVFCFAIEFTVATTCTFALLSYCFTCGCARENSFSCSRYCSVAAVSVQLSGSEFSLQLQTQRTCNAVGLQIGRSCGVAVLLVL